MISRIHVFFLGLVILFASPVKADWVNRTGAESAPNIAEIYIFEDHVRVKLEVYIEDLRTFEELVPDAMLRNPDKNRPSIKHRMHTFANERLQFVTGDGIKLPAILELVEPRLRVDRQSTYGAKIDPLTGEKVKEAPEDKRVLYAEIIYPFPENGRSVQPQQLQIIPPRETDGSAAANIGFVVFQGAVPVIDYRYLAQAEMLNINWQDPWYTQFDNKNLSRHHKYPLMLYLYVEPRQVRLESLMRYGDIADMTGFEFTSPDLNAEEKNRLLLEHVKKYFSNQNTLRIDGIATYPSSVRVDLLSITLSGLKSNSVATETDESSLLVGVSQQHTIEGLPQKVESRWQYFSPRVDFIPTLVTDPVSPLPDFINESAPVLGWRNFLKKYEDPVIQPITVGAGWSINIPFLGETTIISAMPEQQEALIIVDRVLENLRIAFLEKEPTHLTSALVKVLSTKRVDALRNELKKLFSPTISSGGVGSIEAFDEIRIDTLRELYDPNGFSVPVNGSARIAASHWGHVDRRKIQYQLLLDLVQHEGEWRLSDMTVIDMKPVK